MASLLKVYIMQWTFKRPDALLASCIFVSSQLTLCCVARSNSIPPYQTTLTGASLWHLVQAMSKSDRTLTRRYKLPQQCTSATLPSPLETSSCMRYCLQPHASGTSVSLVYSMLHFSSCLTTLISAILLDAASLICVCSYSQRLVTSRG